jgi:hypothetical protein
MSELPRFTTFAQVITKSFTNFLAKPSAAKRSAQPRGYGCVPKISSTCVPVNFSARVLAETAAMARAGRVAIARDHPGLLRGRQPGVQPSVDKPALTPELLEVLMAL